MNNILSMSTRDEIQKFIEGIHSSTEPVNTKYAAMAYLSMCRHPYMSADWLIAEFAWKECLEKIAEDEGENAANMIKTRIQEYYEKKNYFPNL